MEPPESFPLLARELNTLFLLVLESYLFWLCLPAIAFASASTSLRQTAEPKRNVRNGLDPLPWLSSKSSPKKNVASYPVCAFFMPHTVLRHELVKTEIRECGLHNHVCLDSGLSDSWQYQSAGDRAAATDSAPSRTRGRKESRVKILLFLHRHHCFLRRPVRMLRDLGEIGSTDHHLNTKVIEDSGSSSAPRSNPPMSLPEARHGYIPQH